ncbi:hypothetical protein M406DRAFT_35682 [Cryphonectria parasitica EP155]|uniref:PH domain-containing protein n=1 Tax=Cryphonectria parasitica (strain ATCC 38755 / EP155) TaxID=660469 RepID=A0A9P4YBH1_CRYP1|nr:uncharacterized protein M406DRAFT_35682 [Cryphonectria parasitica EP155]KAF3769934.1 hypothetical protein M406DRAFT_35682 [Cryphonectria parasitica EP155]
MADPGGPAAAAAAAAAAAPAPAPPAASSSHNPAIPVGLNEAALDSPTFRCAIIHFADQIEHAERWLEGYVRSSTKVSHDILALEETISAFLRQNIPAGLDGLIDPDYTLLSLKRVGDAQKDWWGQILGVMRRMDGLAAEPIRSFLGGELRTFKEARKSLDAAQRTFDTTLGRYVAQTKTKEPSSLREDAFAVYETRKAYLKASMDYCQLAPQLRFTLDKLLVRVASDVWKEMRRWRDVTFGSNRFADEMDRIRGWSREMEASEAVFKRELQAARRDVGENAMATFKPSRELEDYSSSTVPFLGSRGPMNVQPKDDKAVISEKQGWLFLKTLSGKPARTNWIRRWYYCRNGIFGWLVQGPQGVLQGDEIGVLLCNTRPAVGEERRFCFEIKTKSQNIMLQSETQAELQEWLEVFEVAKKQAFDASADRDTKGLTTGGIDPAFAITPPTIPEFSAKSIEGLEDGWHLDRSGTLPVPGVDAARASFDVGGVGAAPRRSVTGLARDIARDLPREEGESGREHAARIMQRIELHRRQAFGGGSDSAGIAGLISSSSNLLPGYAAYNASVTNLGAGSSPRLQPIEDMKHSSLAPSTLAKAPTSTFLTRAAVSASAGRTVGGDNPPTLPTAVVANYWGSIPWSTLYSSREDDTKYLRLDDDPLVGANVVPEVRTPQMAAGENFPPRYPGELKAHHPQFRLLFPNVPLEEKLVMVFNAAWTSTAAEGSTVASKGMMANGRIYVTSDNMYFYGQQMGLVIAYTLSLDIISEVTAAPGKDCDYIYLHLSQNMNNTGLTRIIIKTFLLDLNLLHSRLNLLVDDLQSEEPMNTSELITALTNLETEQYEKKSPSAESWEEVASNTPIDDGTATGRPVYRNVYNARDRAARPVRKPVPKFQLPAHPVVYEPEGMGAPVEERSFELSSKGCFHVLFGDKSFIFPKLYFERRAKEIAQGPWELMDQGKMSREFKFKVGTFGIVAYAKKNAEKDVVDQQVIDVFSDHFTYVVTYIKTPWHLPHSSSFKIITKVVITHIAKSKCKLALYTKVEWSKKPPLSKALVQRQALEDARRDAEELADVATDQVRKLGPHSRTKRAIQVYGNIGQQTQVVIFTPGETQEDGTAVMPGKKSQKMIRPRTLTEMVLETLRSILESVATSLLMWTFAGVRKIFSVFTTHRVILAALALSLLTNAVFTGREGSSWWTERNAAKFMSRIGVGPNTMMSKAVYIADLEEAVLAPVVVAPEGASECYDTFRSIMNNTSLDSPYEEAGATLSSGNSKATARRLRRTRQRLGSYRHDLLVAMRVVNSIEKEMIQSEWENWLLDEDLRCEQVKMMLTDHSNSNSSSSSVTASAGAGAGGDAQKVMRPIHEKRIASLRQWHSEYCGSCRVEKDKILLTRMKMVDA